MDAGNESYVFCAVIAAVAIPLTFRWVPPNPLYGVRTPTTMRDRGIWYDANAFGGRLLIASAVVSAALIWLGARSALALLVPLGLAVVASLLYVRHLSHGRTP